MALGLGVLLLIVLGALLRAGLALGAAYALTTYVTLPSAVGTLAWVAAGAFALLQLVGAGVGLAALLTASSTKRRFR